MATHIRGTQSGENGRNESYIVHGRGEVSRKKMVSETKAGQHPDHSVYSREGEEYLRAKPDTSTSNNVNKE